MLFTSDYKARNNAEGGSLVGKYVWRRIYILNRLALKAAAVLHPYLLSSVCAMVTHVVYQTRVIT